jgi:Ca2+-binding EF-hand superfamily protein
MAHDASPRADPGNEGDNSMNDPSLLERNIDAAFTIFDIDADGFLTSADLMALGALACEQLRITGSPQAAALLDSHAAWWEQLRADCDADGDGRISRAEFAHAILSGDGDPQAYYSQQLAKLQGLIAQALDADGDGFIEQAEYLTAFDAPGMDRQAVLAAFERLDADGDGRISREEYAAFAAQFFLSSDQAHPGTSILGPA